MMQILHGIPSEKEEDMGDDGSDGWSESGSDHVTADEPPRKRKKKVKRMVKNEKQKEKVRIFTPIILKTFRD